MMVERETEVYPTEENGLISYWLYQKGIDIVRTQRSRSPLSPFLFEDDSFAYVTQLPETIWAVGPNLVDLSLGTIYPYSTQCRPDILLFDIRPSHPMLIGMVECKSGGDKHYWDKITGLAEFTKTFRAHPLLLSSLLNQYMPEDFYLKNLVIPPDSSINITFLTRRGGIFNYETNFPVAVRSLPQSQPTMPTVRAG